MFEDGFSKKYKIEIKKNLFSVKLKKQDKLFGFYIEVKNDQVETFKGDRDGEAVKTIKERF